MFVEKSHVQALILLLPDLQTTSKENHYRSVKGNEIFICLSYILQSITIVESRTICFRIRNKEDNLLH